MSKAIADLLKSHGLRPDDEAIDRIEHELSLARPNVGARERMLPSRAAGPLKNAATRLLDAAKEYGLIDDDDLDVIRLLKAKAEFAEFDKQPPGTKSRPWLGSCAEGLLEAWQAFGGKSDAVYAGSKAVAFIVECCHQIDGDVGDDAVADALDDLRGVSNEELDRDFVAWFQSPAGKISIEIRAIEKRLAARRKRPGA